MSPKTTTMEDVLMKLEDAKEVSETAQTIKALSKELHDFQEALDKLMDYIKNGRRDDA